MAMEPTAVTIHDSSEIAPTCAMFVGSMMMPEPIMFTATMNVSWTTFIRFRSCTTPPPTFSVATLMIAPRTSRVYGCRPPFPGELSRESFAHHVGVEHDAAVHALLVDALHFVVEAWEAVERLLEGEEIVEHRLRLAVPALTRDDDSDPGRIDQRKCRGDAALDAFEGHIVHLVRDQR